MRLAVGFVFDAFRVGFKLEGGMNVNWTLAFIVALVLYLMWKYRRFGR